MSKVQYTKSSEANDASLQSLILEVDIKRDDNTTSGGIAIFRDNDEWKVMIHAGFVRSETITWEQFLEIAHKSAIFVSQENELLLKGEG